MHRLISRIASSIAASAARGRARPLLPAVTAGVLLGFASLPATADEIGRAAEAWAGADSRTLSRAAPRLVDATLSPVFEGMERRVGAYAEWVYGWLSSLLTTWDLTAAAAREAQRELSAGRLPDGAAIHAELLGVVQRRFDATVVMPDRTDAALAGGWRRAMTRLAALDEVLAAERRRRIAGMAALLGADPGPALRQFGSPLLPATLAAAPPPARLSIRALSTEEDGAGGTADRVLFRSLRPLVSRTLSVSTRLLLAPAAGGLAAAPFAGTEGFAAAVTTMVGVSAGIWGLDYALNSLDSALTREGFERSLRLLVRESHDRMSREARHSAATVACAALAATVPCRPHQPVAGTSGGG